PEALVEALRARLAPAKLPRTVVFVEALPRNPNGKVDAGRARALLAGAAAQPPETST
ncbi:MAG: AMP-dependent synthetase, partial [Gemmatimonadetes bacterium]